MDCDYEDSNLRVLKDYTSSFGILKDDRTDCDFVHSNLGILKDAWNVSS